MKRSALRASIVGVSFATLLSSWGCDSEPTQPVDPARDALVIGSGTSNGTTGNPVSGSGGAANSGGAASSGGAVSVVVGGGGLSSSGGAAIVLGGGGSSSGGAAVVGSGGAAAAPCLDLEAPDDPEWPEANCELWAADTDACGEEWFATYCDLSCGRCVPAGGGTGSGGSSAVVETCEDLAAPEDPEWPGATCENWATESDACGEDWFSEYCDVSCGRCVPEGGLPEKAGPPDCSGEGLPNVTGGEGHATRYWDCCQTHCSQFNGQKCSQDGVSSTGDGTSSCQGGGSYACYSEAPHAVSTCLSYGHVAKANADCGGCYRIQFTGQGEYNDNDPGSKLIKGMQMIVKVSNTGSDVAGNQLDLMVPGGGVGQFNACSNQWGTSDLGAQYGGFLTDCTGAHSAKKECVRQECMKIPEGDARDGCIWFVDWFQVADNPKFTSTQTDCPF